ncbi:MAG: GAF domain-containing protein [Bacteroidia bacterium]
MSGTLQFSSSPKDRKARFLEFIPQWRAIIHGEKDEIACLANTSSALMEAFSFHWIGFYRVIINELVLGPFQGPVACTRIANGKGVCGTAWMRNESILVPNVEEFPGHIACSALSKSELVLPLRDINGKVIAVLDIDSSELNDFSIDDLNSLEFICRELEKQIYH